MPKDQKKHAAATADTMQYVVNGPDQRSSSVGSRRSNAKTGMVPASAMSNQDRRSRTRTLEDGILICPGSLMLCLDGRGHGEASRANR
jgi:hypothetical protein